MSAPVPDVKAATQRAQQELDWLRCHKEASLEAWQEHVRAYVLARFLLDREEEDVYKRQVQHTLGPLGGGGVLQIGPLPIRQQGEILPVHHRFTLSYKASASWRTV